MKIAGSVFGGALLVAGTCIGAGMLGLPVTTAAAGFYPTLGAFLVVWFFMTVSALAYLEVSLRFKGETNLISMAGRTLGPFAKSLAWITYILFLYSLMAAYTSGGITMMAELMNFKIENQKEWLLIAIDFIAPFGLMVFLGAAWVDRLNRLLMLGLIVAFVGMCALAFKIGPADHFYPVGESKYLLFTVPLLVTSFGFHLLIPTLKSYLNDDVVKLRWVILIGSFLPLAVYSIWQLIIMNLIPTWGADGLVQILRDGKNPANSIASSLEAHGPVLRSCVIWFCFFALTSSFIGVGLGISDFFSDGLKIHKTKKGRAILSALTFIPPLIYTLIYPQGFLLALTYAGVFAAILLIIFPICMAWSARYVNKLHGKYTMRGGKALLIIALIFGVFVVFADIFQRMGILPVP